MPLVYVLACDKRADTYDLILSTLVRLQPNLDPARITIDFEKAAIIAIQKVFPNASIHGCNFHLGQNLWRHVQQVGLQARYSDDPDFAHNLRLVFALAFIPIDDVADAFSDLTETTFFA